MFKFTKRDKRSTLEKEIDGVIEIMSKETPCTEEYTAMANNLKRLYEAKGVEPKRRVSPDTLMLVACNLLGIVLILTYEKANIITSKALSFVFKGRV